MSYSIIAFPLLQHIITHKLPTYVIFFLINLKLTSIFFSYQVFQYLAIIAGLLQKPYKDKYTALDRNLKRGMRLAELYEPYVFFKGM